MRAPSKSLKFHGGSFPPGPFSPVAADVEVTSPSLVLEDPGSDLLLTSEASTVRRGMLAVGLSEGLSEDEVTAVSEGEATLVGVVAMSPGGSLIALRIDVRGVHHTLHVTLYSPYTPPQIHHEELFL